MYLILTHIFSLIVADKNCYFNKYIENKNIIKLYEKRQ